jgi:hypothetical protein
MSKPSRKLIAEAIEAVLEDLSGQGVFDVWNDPTLEVDDRESIIDSCIEVATAILRKETK